MINYESALERMTSVLEKLNNPHKKLPPIIHVAGTNGKGSVCAFLAKILEVNNIKTHKYTSPHLHNCNERIEIASEFGVEKISDGGLFEVMEEARIGAGETALTFFEGFTIGAILAFAQNPADVVIIECGMGGRIDPTNIFGEKLATAITPISLDHTEYLGDSIEKIALEKSLIMRRNTPVVIGPQSNGAKKIIDIIADDFGAKKIRYDEEFSIALDEEDGSFDYEFFDRKITCLPAPSLVGEHQYINASMAISLALLLPFKIDEGRLRLGISSTRWQSRLEKIDGNLEKILENPASEIFIDGAHNQGGAFAIARWIQKERSLDSTKNLARNYFVICGFTKNKCKKSFLENFIQIADKLVAVRVNGEPNPENPEIVAKIGSEIGLEIPAFDDLISAVCYLKELSGKAACRLIICGSLHLARDLYLIQSTDF
jgi:dihydrofolate synthase/folylpolyglutamate synthase